MSKSRSYSSDNSPQAAICVGLLTDSHSRQRFRLLQNQYFPAINLIETADLTPFASVADWQTSNYPYLLGCINERLQLLTAKPGLQPLCVDFTAGTTAYRLQQNVRNELLIKALLGRAKQSLPSVLDATAGLGKDSLLVAMLGSSVIMMERNPVVLALLADGLARLQTVDVEITARLQLMGGDFLQCYNAAESEPHQQEQRCPDVDVVYLDPMFPQREKSARVKKDMQIFQDLVGKDLDSDALLSVALSVAKKRVLVKRPLRAPFLANKQPTYSVSGRSSRFDVYQAA